jgi:hypothetical protein
LAPFAQDGIVAALDIGPDVATLVASHLSD